MSFTRMYSHLKKSKNIWLFTRLFVSLHHQNTYNMESPPKKYDFTQVPKGWKFCFNSQCPMHGECLRFQTALEMPDDRKWGSAVFPPAQKNGQCKFFKKDEKVILATGFVTANFAQNDMFVKLRHRLTDYLGGNGSYYLYRNGKKWLSPTQQEGIREIFRKAGYRDEIIFKKQKEDYNFL